MNAEKIIEELQKKHRSKPYAWVDCLTSEIVRGRLYSITELKKYIFVSLVTDMYKYKVICYAKEG